MKIFFKGQPLSTQHIYRSVCRGSFPVRYMTKEGKELKEQYQLEARKQYKGKVMLADYDMEIILFFKDKRRRDVDNYNKLVLDALEGVVYEDDKQVKRLTVEKRISVEDPRIEIKIIKTKK